MVQLVETYGPWALVTGASQGIGAEFARQLAALGFNLILTSRRLAPLQSLEQELGAAYGVEIVPLAFDLSARGFVATLDAAIAERNIGLVISNAGMRLQGAHGTQSEEALTQLVNTNTLAPLLLTNYFIPRLAQRSRSAIVLVSSLEGFMGWPYSSAYSASKSFVNSLGEALWEEGRHRNIDILVSCPGATLTPMLDKAVKVDPTAIRGVKSPREVVAETLAHIGAGPLHQIGSLNRVAKRILQAMPRRLALRTLSKQIKPLLREPEKISG